MGGTSCSILHLIKSPSSLLLMTAGLLSCVLTNSKPLYETWWCWFLHHSVTNCHLKITASLIGCSGYQHHWEQLQRCAVACGWSHADICLDSLSQRRIGGTKVPHGGIKMYAKPLLKQLLSKFMLYCTVFLSHSPHSSTWTWVSMLVASPHPLETLHYSPTCVSAS